jgi:cell division protein FtsL
MTHNVAHTNKMLFDLKQQYQDRITDLQQKITEQQREILCLQEQIKYMSKDRFYDC